MKGGIIVKIYGKGINRSKIEIRLSAWCPWPITLSGCGECSCVTYEEPTYCPSGGHYFFPG